MFKRLLNVFCIVTTICLSLHSCKKNNQKQQGTVFTKLNAGETGVNFSNNLIEKDTFNIIFQEFYYNGSGVSAADVNNDGLTDLFFGSNMQESKLYLNKGNFKFEDITKASGIDTKNKWVTGINFVDINQDGWLDIYICVGGLTGKGFQNLFYISNANAENLQFTEHASEMGLNDADYSTQAAFFDYDKDGDLDMYLVTSSMNITHKNRVRNIKKDGSMPNTDKFYRNDGINASTGLPKFTNISKEAGIQIDGFGLGVSVSDINQDGWPDIYIANDFISNDLLYINQKNGTFKNQLSSYFKHTSYSAMGTDIADVNNDGLVDVIAVDMLPPDNYRKRIMAGAGRSYNRYLIEKKKGYTEQYIRNTLQINNGNNTFSEVGQLAGVHETDWSWAPLLADFDNDGLRDLFIANGIPKDITNMDFVSYQASKAAFSPKALLKELKKTGTVDVSNYMFKNNGNLQFDNVTKNWGLQEPSFANSAVYVDLDNDGDLDIVTNNINQKAAIYKNNSRQKDTLHTNFVQLTLTSKGSKTKAIGARVDLYANGEHQVYENYPNRGFLSTQDYKVHFGVGKNTKIDSLIIKWPNGNIHFEKNIKANQLLSFQEKNANNYTQIPVKEKEKLFELVNKSLDIDYEHKELEFNDFKIQPLIPHQFSKEGAGVAVADVNNDGLQDFYIGAATGSAGQLYIQQKSGKFVPTTLDENLNFEDMGVLFFDADNDGDEDLYIASGGTGLPPNHPMYKDRLYINNNGNFTLNENALPNLRYCSSKVTAADFDKDGDLDLFIGSRINLEQYPLPPKSVLLLNESKNGKVIFKDVAHQHKDLQKIGLVSDAIWSDYNNDGWQDLIVVGQWMPVTIFKNEQGTLKNVTNTLGLASFTGWYNSITAADFDKDGDIDYVIGNLGLNSRFTASKEQPLEIFAKDFSKNGYIDPICTYYIDSVRYPIYNRDLLYKQLPYLQKKLPTYTQYAKAPFESIFSKVELENAYHANSTILTSVFIENKGSSFEVKPLPKETQVAPVFGMLSDDFNLDGKTEVIGIGNSYSSDVETGHYDASIGMNLLYENNNFVSQNPLNTGFIASGDGKGIAQLNLSNGNRLILAVQNNNSLLAYKVKATVKPYKMRTTDAYALISYNSGKTEKKEFYYGGNYLSHSARVLYLPTNVKSVVIVDNKGKRRNLDF